MLPFFLGGTSLLIPVVGAGVGAYYARSRGVSAWDGLLLGLAGPLGWLVLGLVTAEARGGWGGPVEEDAAGWVERTGPPPDRLERWARRLYRPTLAAMGAALAAGIGLIGLSRAGAGRGWLLGVLAAAGALSALGTFLLWGLGVSLLLADTRPPLRKRARWGTALVWLSAPAALLFHPWRWRGLARGDWERPEGVLPPDGAPVLPAEAPAPARPGERRLDRDRLG